MPVAKETGKDFTPLPAGSHIARCFGVISLGTQNSPMYPASFKVMVMFEVPGEVIEIDGKKNPMTIQKEYTLSLSEKASLRRDLQSWRGREFTAKELEGFDVANVCGAPCMLSVIHKTSANKKTYANITAIGSLPKGVECPPQWHKKVIYEIEQEKDDVFNSLPKWIQTKIEACDEWQLGPEPTAVQPQVTHDDGPPEEDSVPFNKVDALPPKKHDEENFDLCP